MAKTKPSLNEAPLDQEGDTTTTTTTTNHPAPATKTKKEPTPSQMITMDDGRIVEFRGKRRALTEALSVEGNLSVRVDLVSGETRTLNILPSLLEKFALHGARQKLSDSMAGIEDMADATEALTSTIDSLAKGEWAQTRAASEFAGASDLVRALVEYSGRTVDDVRTMLGAHTSEQKKALRNSAPILPIVLRLEAERRLGKGKATEDTSAALLQAFAV